MPDAELSAKFCPMDLDKWLTEATGAVRAWEAGYGEYARHPALEVSDEAFAPVL